MDTSNPTFLIVATVYYFFVVLISFFSVFSIYILLRYGRSQILSFVVSVLYIIFFLSTLGHSHGLLQTLK